MILMRKETQKMLVKAKKIDFKLSRTFQACKNLTELIFLRMEQLSIGKILMILDRLQGRLPLGKICLSESIKSA